MTSIEVLIDQTMDIPRLEMLLARDLLGWEVWDDERVKGYFLGGAGYCLPSNIWHSQIAWHPTQNKEDCLDIMVAMSKRGGSFSITHPLAPADETPMITYRLLGGPSSLRSVAVSTKDILLGICLSAAILLRLELE